MLNSGNRQIVLKQSNDIFNDILLPLKERSRDNDKRYVYFYRIIGFNDLTEFISKTAVLHQKLANLGNLYLYFVDNIPIPFNRSLSDRINAIFVALNRDKPVQKPSTNTGKDGMQAGILCDAIAEAGLFTVHATGIKDAFKTVLGEYFKKETPNNSQVKNFVSKLLLWLHEYLPELYKIKSPWNPKVLYYGDIKKHPVYFLILLSRIGCDVLYINPYSDLDYKKVDSNNRFSMLLEGKNKSKIKNHPVTKINKPGRPVDIERLCRVVPVKGFSAVVKLKSSNDILNDIKLPLNKRSGYIGNPAPVLPVYFYRYIGIDGTIGADEYYNKLYQLDKSLQNGPNGFVRITNQLTMPGNDEITNYRSKLQHAGTLLLYGSEKDFLVSKVINAGILPATRSQPLDNTIKTAFNDVMDLFVKIEPTSSKSKLENFALKLVAWINRYFKLLYKTFDFVDSPKILYYGDIKSHEVYLLIYFSKIGCDVLYVNTDIQKDDVFKQIDVQEEYTKLIQNDLGKELEPFPETERVVRKATVAYNASREIQQVIYSGDAGLFKPWQFENSLTRPVTLKTTYDELIILWQEEARVRPEFKVVYNTVYVPNLFAKIKGTHEDLGQYRRDFRKLATRKNTHVIYGVPFTGVNYSKRDLYASAFLIDDSGSIDREKLYKSSFYRYGYLRTSLQEFIINKIEELIKSDMFVIEDRELPLKILMTVLTMDESILRLLETFDFPGEVPKVVVYDGTKDVFSDEDAIIIAFLNLVGMDIAIFTPTNYNNIELKLKEELVDIHQLPSVQLDLKMPDIRTKPADENIISAFLNNVSSKIRRKFH